MISRLLKSSHLLNPNHSLRNEAIVCYILLFMYLFFYFPIEPLGVTSNYQPYN